MVRKCGNEKVSVKTHPSDLNDIPITLVRSNDKFVRVWLVQRWRQTLHIYMSITIYNELPIFQYSWKIIHIGRSSNYRGQIKQPISFVVATLMIPTKINPRQDDCLGFCAIVHENVICVTLRLCAHNRSTPEVNDQLRVRKCNHITNAKSSRMQITPSQSTKYAKIVNCTMGLTLTLTS